VLQSRSATSIASFIHFCTTPLLAGRANPTDKVIRNLITFLCQDTSINPVFNPILPDFQIAILSLKEDKSKKPTKVEQEGEESEEAMMMRVMRRGALLAFEELAKVFAGELFEKVPKLWEGLSSTLSAIYQGVCLLSQEGIED
jgi:TATA-binding protein-associated factor